MAEPSCSSMTSSPPAPPVARRLEHSSKPGQSASSSLSWRELSETARPMSSTPIKPLTLRIGTRGSRLARWQAEWVANRLRGCHPGLNVELVAIHTQGDRDRNSRLAAIGGTGLFTKEIQRAVLDGLVDIAVHSLKDLPTQGPDELV